MIKSVFFSICIALFVFMAACGQSGSDDGVQVIDLQEIVKGKREYVLPDQLAKKSWVIPLETTDASLLRFGSRVYYTGEYVYAEGANSFLLFDTEGRFLRMIGRKGQGPEEYTFASSLFLQGDILNIYESDKGRILRFNTEGQLTGIVPLQKNLHAIYPLGDKYITFLSNYTGKQTDHFLLLDRQGEILDHIPYPEQEGFQIVAFFNDEGVFFEGNKQLNFKEIFNDTLYVVQDFRFIPRMFFDVGEKRIKPDTRREYSDFRSYILADMAAVHVLGETNQYLYFCLEMDRKKEILVFDKKQKTTKVLQVEEENREDVQIDVRIKQGGDKDLFLIVQVDELDTEDNPILKVYSLL